MKKKLILLVITILLSLVLLDCGGGKSLVGDFVKEGVKVSYAPAVGDTFYYRQNTDSRTEFSVKGNFSSTLSKTRSYESFTVNSVVNDTTEVTYKYLFTETGVFRSGSYEKSDEEDPTIGQTFTIIVGPDGKLVNWRGLDDLEFDSESEIDRGEMIASDYACLYFDHFPPEPIKIGSTWERENTMEISTEKGEMHRRATKTYTVDDFVLRDDRKCVKCRINIEINNESEGTGASEEGTFSVRNEGRGEGNGILYFDFETGIPTYSSINWTMDFKQLAVDNQTQEEYEFTYYQEQKVVYSLVDKSEVPE